MTPPPPPRERIDRTSEQDVPAAFLPVYHETPRDLARIDYAEHVRDWGYPDDDDAGLDAYEAGIGLR